jgi:hypothetical protein
MTVLLKENYRNYNACLRYVYKRSKRDSLQNLQTSLWGLILENSAKVQQLTFLFKILHLRHPSYLYTHFTFASSARMRNLITPIHRTLGKSQSFTVVGTKAWNNLPHSIRLLQSLSLRIWDIGKRVILKVL